MANRKSTTKRTGVLPFQLEQLKKIVTTLDDLTTSTKNAGLEDAHGVVQAAFKLCLTLYYLEARGEKIA